MWGVNYRGPNFFQTRQVLSSIGVRALLLLLCTVPLGAMHAETHATRDTQRQFLYLPLLQHNGLSLNIKAGGGKRHYAAASSKRKRRKSMDLRLCVCVCQRSRRTRRRLLRLEERRGSKKVAERWFCLVCVCQSAKFG